MSRRLISSGSAFEQQFGYSRAVVSGPWVFVSGCTGYDYAAHTISSSIEDQAEQCMRNIDAALREAGSSVADVVRVQYVLVDRKDITQIQGVLHKWFGEVRPAAMMIQAGLKEEVMKIEIEVTAKTDDKKDG